MGKNSKCPTGQLISECPFDVLNFPKNQQKALTNFCPRIAVKSTKSTFLEPYNLHRIIWAI